jgi:hypothetical protein
VYIAILCEGEREHGLDISEPRALLERSLAESQAGFAARMAKLDTLKRALTNILKTGPIGQA